MAKNAKLKPLIKEFNSNLKEDVALVCKDEIIDKLKFTVQDLLEALDAPFPDSCDCGGSRMCAICNAYRVLGELNG